MTVASMYVRKMYRAEQRGVASELLRLVVNEQALDGKGSLLLSTCGTSISQCRWDHACARGSAGG